MKHTELLEIKKNTINLKEKWTEKTKQIPEEINDLTNDNMPNLKRDQGNTNINNDIESFTTKTAK